MSQSSFPDRSDRPHLRLHRPEEDAGAQPEDNIPLSPRMSLSEFFERWFLPIVLKDEDAGDSTIKLHRDAIRWWIALTNDPPLRLIDEYTVIQFKEGLRNATYQRGKLGQPRPLSKFTIVRHIRLIRSIVYRCGPTTDPERPAKGILESIPAIKAKSVKGKPKPCFSVDQAKKLAAAASQMECPQVPGIPTAAWWRALLSILFYSGLRIGTVMKLKWSMLVSRDDGPWLEVPGEIVDKTEKETEIALPSHCLPILHAVRTVRDKMFPWPHHKRHLRTVHEDLQAAAGIPEGKRLSVQAWRRTHSKELARLGIKLSLRVAKESLDHSDERITSQFYSDLTNELRVKLPPLWTPEIDERQRKLF